MSLSIHGGRAPQERLNESEGPFLKLELNISSRMTSFPSLPREGRGEGVRPAANLPNERQTLRLFFQKFADGFQVFHVVADGLDGHEDGDTQQ